MWAVAALWEGVPLCGRGVNAGQHAVATVEVEVEVHEVEVDSRE